MSRRLLRLIASSAILVGLLIAAPAAQSRTATTLTMNVTFFANGTISLTLPDGTAVGSTSGTPTVIPAGFYTLVLIGPGGCTNLPYFDLKGPGNNILDNMNEGETANATDNANFLPNSTYTWRNDENPGVVYTFSTSSDVVGTPPAQPGASGLTAGKHGTAKSQNPIVGSGIAPFRGALTGAVSSSGGLTVAYKGKSITSLAAGRYKITVTDRSSTRGFMLEKAARTVNVTGAAFVGKHTATVDLTAGRWLFTPVHGGSSFAVVVH